MSTIKASEETNYDRRRFLRNAAMTFAAPSSPQSVILLLGWPYDIHSYVDVAPLLTSAGYRVIVPFLRGYGTTRFLSSETFRHGQQSVVALDVIALMDALKIDRLAAGRGCLRLQFCENQ